MISCTEFIPAYSALFTEIHQRGGKHGVARFWEYLSDSCLDNLRSLVEEKGLAGCWEYWERSLNEEAADFFMELDEAAGIFRIEMQLCPSKGRLLQIPHITPYPHYCEHCDTLYRRVLEPLGYKYRLDLSGCDEARCAIVVSIQENESETGETDE